MDEALNHTQSALASSLRLLNRAQYYLDKDSFIAQEIKRNIAEFIKGFNIEL